MDDFGIDLDKVLDDFELSEGGPSATKSESKHNLTNNLPTLQPPVSAGSVYASPQATPLPPPYTPNTSSNSNYRQCSPFTNEYDLSYNTQGEYSVPQPNSVIHTTMETEGCQEVLPTKPHMPGRLELIKAQPQQNHNNQQWMGINNNSMSPSYQYPTGVLAHGERSNGNMLQRRLSDDRPELLRSTQEPPSTLSPYPGNITNISPLAYAVGGAVSHVHPDVVPVSLNSIVDRVPNRITAMQANDLGVNYSHPSDIQISNPSANKSRHDSSLMCLSNGDLGIPQQSMSIQVLLPEESTVTSQQGVSLTEIQQNFLSEQEITKEQVTQQEAVTLPQQQVTLQQSISQPVTQHQTMPQVIQQTIPVAQQVTPQPVRQQTTAQPATPQQTTAQPVTQQQTQVTQTTTPPAQTTPQLVVQTTQAQVPSLQQWTAIQSVTPQTLPLPGVPQDDRSLNQCCSTSNPSLLATEEKNIDDMKVESASHNLQSDKGDQGTIEMNSDIKSKSEGSIIFESPKPCSKGNRDQITCPNECNQSEVVSHSNQCSSSMSSSLSSEVVKDGSGSQLGYVTVGFGDIEQEDITDDDMDAYLAMMEAADAPSTVPQPKAPHTQSSLQFSNSENQRLIKDQSGTSTETHESESCPDIHETAGNVEKFLAPAIMSPRIATPMDDPGFSKVPGYMPASSVSTLQRVETVVEEDEEEEDMGEISSLGNSEVIKTRPDTKVIPVMTVSQGMSDHMQNVPQIETDCVMTMVEQSKEDVSHAGISSGAITVSFPAQRETSQPMDTSSGDRSEAIIPMAGSGARPKESTVNRKSRPNSLLGLSKPDLNITVPVVSSVYEMHDSGSGESGAHAHAVTCSKQVLENAHDIINRQLAQKARSSLQKKQLNLQIKQHLDDVVVIQNMETSSTESLMASRMGSNEAASSAVTGISVVTNRAQLASGVGFNLPLAGSLALQRDSDPAGGGEDAISSSSSSSLLSIQQLPSPARAAQYHQATPNTAAPVEASTTIGQQEYEHQRPAEFGADGECEQNTGAKLKRPTSLSLMPRSDFQVSGEKDSTEEDSATGDASSGSSGGNLTSFTAKNMISEPAGAMASSGAEFYSPPEVGPGAFSPTPRSSNANVAVTQLGHIAPRWVPDAEACNCMQCEARFTFTKRRHHCRACGKVFCNTCCNVKCKLQYMENKEARVCSKCYQDIVRAQAYERMHSPNRSPNPNNPAEYCSTIPPLQQAASSRHAPPPVVMVPVGVLRKEGSQRSREPKQVMFSDGIRPGGDLTELDGSDIRLPLRRHSRSSKKVERLAATAAAAAGATGPATTDSSLEASTSKSPSPKTRVKRLPEPALRPVCLIPDIGLPPVIMSTGVKGDFTLEEDPNPETIMPKVRSTEDPNPVVFAINKNLFVLVKIVNLDCCLNRVCWCFSTKGMCTVGQDEVVLVLECLPDEKTVPRDIFCHLNSVYNEASKGNTVSHLGHTIFGQSFLGSRDHCGFLYVRPTFQCVQKLLLPQPPYVFGLLLQKWETPWAKVFPIRLMLRLGAEYRYYPCPLISVRFRKPVYGEIGHTIMNLLADFRNYQYMLPQIRGVVIHMEEKKTFINFPRNRYDEVMKVITNSNDHVMALGANFSTDADSHLVCIQNDDGNYQTQAINIQNKPRKVTGASFVVFNGALKTSSGLRAKSSIVEDGLMVQITSEAMGQLKAALLDMKDYTISCGALDQPTPDEQVIVQWMEDDHKVNQGVKSPIDGLPMDGIESIHIHNGTDYVGETRTIRWTEVFFIQNEDSSNSRGEPVDLSRLAEMLAGACCIALTSHLDKLRESGLVKLGLRCTIDRDKVGYEVGANGERLPDNYMNDLDNELIPVIHNAGSQSQDGPVVLELIFYIIE